MTPQFSGSERGHAAHTRPKHGATRTGMLLIHWTRLNTLEPQCDLPDLRVELVEMGSARLSIGLVFSLPWTFSILCSSIYNQIYCSYLT